MNFEVGTLVQVMEPVPNLISRGLDAMAYSNAKGTVKSVSGTRCCVMFMTDVLKSQWFESFNLKEISRQEQKYFYFYVAGSVKHIKWKFKVALKENCFNAHVVDAIENSVLREYASFIPANTTIAQVFIQQVIPLGEYTESEFSSEKELKIEVFK